MCFSALSESRLIGIRKIVGRIIESEGFLLNHKKTRFQGPSTCRKITGLVFSKDAYGVGRDKKRVLRARIFNLISAFNNNTPDERLKAAQNIHGWVSFLNSVDSQGHSQLVKFAKKVFFKAVSVNKIDPTLV